MHTMITVAKAGALLGSIGGGALFAAAELLPDFSGYGNAGVILMIVGMFLTFMRYALQMLEKIAASSHDRIEAIARASDERHKENLNQVERIAARCNGGQS